MGQVNKLAALSILMALVALSANLFRYCPSLLNAISMEQDLIIGQIRGSQDKTSFETHLNALRVRDPESDAISCYKIGDDRYITFSALDIFVPGNNLVAKNTSTKHLFGGSDNYTNPQVKEVSELAYRYAHTYNTALANLIAKEKIEANN